MICSRNLKMKLMVEQLMRKKSVAFKAQDNKTEEESGCKEEESNEEMALFVKRFNRMMGKNWQERTIIKKKFFC